MTNAVTLASLANSGYLRNRIINGAMQIDQRNGGAAVTASGSFPVDRFNFSNATDGAFSAQRSSTAPTGFTNSLYFTTTTADASLGATQYASIVQAIEGLNVGDLALGTVDAKPFTLSFWVRSSLTGTFGGAFLNNANNRSYPFTYVISSANTWEYKTITAPGDTTGTWLTDNGAGLKVCFGLGVGATYSGTAGAWSGSLLLSATGAVSVIGTLNATFYITGVQLEVGTQATPFEWRPYGLELALCQRYYTIWTSPQFIRLAISYSDTSTTSQFTLPVPVTMRATPTLSTAYLTVQGVAFSSTALTNYASGIASIQAGVSGGLSVGAAQIYSASGQTGIVVMSAEL